jgi:pantoate--beta-alanine ligase
MIVVRTIPRTRSVVANWRRRGLSVGFVPTMGALHDGHLALIQRSLKMCDRTVVSIFVNPTQFGPREDFRAYPRTWSADLDACNREGVDLIFAPSVSAMYPEGHQTTVKAGPLGDLWEGASRPGHFDGVTTVVAKLFNIVAPDIAVFGQKDYQQSVIIRRMVTDLNLPVRILVAPTVRGWGGLALSSRNAYLDLLTRSKAQSIHRALAWAAARVRLGETSSSRLAKGMRTQIETGRYFKIDYIGLCDPETLSPKKKAAKPLVILVAARCLVKGPAFGRRYIDNVLVGRLRHPCL